MEQTYILWQPMTSMREFSPFFLLQANVSASRFAMELLHDDALAFHSTVESRQSNGKSTAHRLFEWGKQMPNKEWNWNMLKYSRMSGIQLDPIKYSAVLAARIRCRSLMTADPIVEDTYDDLQHFSFAFRRMYGYGACNDLLFLSLQTTPVRRENLSSKSHDFFSSGNSLVWCSCSRCTYDVRILLYVNQKKSFHGQSCIYILVMNFAVEKWLWIGSDSQHRCHHFSKSILMYDFVCTSNVFFVA